MKRILLALLVGSLAGTSTTYGFEGNGENYYQDSMSHEDMQDHADGSVAGDYRDMNKLEDRQLTRDILNWIVACDVDLVEQALELNDIELAAKVALKVGAKINKKYNNATLLELALTDYQNAKTALLLIEHGAAFWSIRDRNDKDAMDLALDMLSYKTKGSITRHEMQLINTLFYNSFHLLKTNPAQTQFTYLDSDYEYNIWIKAIRQSQISGSNKVLPLLLNWGADVNQLIIKNRGSTWTPLMRAIWLGNTEAVQFLIENGADVNQTTWPEGLPISPLDFAIQLNQKDIETLLNNNGASACNLTGLDDDPKIIQFLLTKKN